MVLIGTFDIVYESKDWICEQDEHGNTLWTNKRCFRLIKVFDPEEKHPPKNTITAVYYFDENGARIDLTL